jgi:outer membrane protein assembly factor BamE (lipoprotein component of BamABCDE complex)
MIKNNVIVCAIALVLMNGCSPTAHHHGHTIHMLPLDKVVVGKTSKDDVRQMLGSPSSGSSFRDNAWYYVYDKVQTIAFSKPEIVEQQLICIRFDSNEMVKEVTQDIHNPDLMAVPIDPKRTKIETAGNSNFLKDMIQKISSPKIMPRM